ncbi:MAG: 3-deoxy-manno-octulosonate cytidylyltransferase [Rhizobiales bacterium]|nr:3-deoxy-manno-octulosonate cytidylyltransferase [Hyphomicrobiales bacterium]
MSVSDDTVVLIPSRMASTRLPGKPVADICGTPMIVHVMQRGQAAELGPVVVAACEPEVVEAVEMANGEVVMTDPDLPSGSDRIAAALNTIDPGGVHKFVINLQGDLPTIDPGAITACLDALKTTEADISTLAAPITDAEELANPNVVKALARFNKNETVSLASDFARTLPSTWDGPHLHHIGIYAYRRHALERFVSLPVSKREAEHKLEQLRALDNGMKIAVALVDTVPFGVDTPADLDRARALLAPRQSVTE